VSWSDSVSSESASHTEALKVSHWHKAMREEYEALIKNGTRTLVPSQSGINLVDCKWIFKTKRHVDGSVERYKARLAAKGSTSDTVWTTMKCLVLLSNQQQCNFFSLLLF
jgi:hypothetical protein